jgi:TPR repeat protein
MRTTRIVAAALFASLLTGAAFAAPNPQAVTKCDRLAANPDDPDRNTIGVPQPEVDLLKAVSVCKRELKRQPDNQRIRYQYARVSAYSGDWETASAEMKKAADAGYRQAQFVYGLFVAREREGMPRDLCLAEQYWLMAAKAGRKHARVQYADYYLNGKFSGCQTGVTAAELQQLLEAGASEATDFFERMLINMQLKQLAAQANQ